MSYSCKLLPYKGLLIKADIDKLLEITDFSLARRCDAEKTELQQCGNSYVIPLDSDILENIYQRIPFMSMTYIDEPDTLESASYRLDSNSSSSWNGENIDFSKCAYNAEKINTCFQLVYCAKKLHNIEIPYKRKFEKEHDAIKYGISKTFLKDFSKNEAYDFKGKIRLKHSPTMLNYRHFELELYDSNETIIKKVSSLSDARNKPKRNGSDHFSIYVLDHILAKNFEVDKIIPSTNSLPEDAFYDSNISQEEREKNKSETYEQFKSIKFEKMS